VHTPHKSRCVVIWDPRRDGSWTYDVEAEVLAANGISLLVPESDRASDSELSQADVLVVASPLPSSSFELLTGCVGIVCYSVGMDAVDLDAATAAGIPVTNAAGYCTDEVSDHAMGLILALQRRLVECANLAAAGDWSPYFASGSLGLRRTRGQTMGIIGAGRIGSAVAAKAAAFGMEILAYDPFLDDHHLPYVTLVDLPRLLSRSDVVVVCCPLTTRSRHLIDAEAVASMKPGSALVNVARGGIVDEEALAFGLDTGQLSGVGLDVRELEPPDPGRDLLRQRANAILTQHLAGTSAQSHHDLHVVTAMRCVELLRAADRGKHKGGEV
jgi:D-3-phosphoglycerate dehydrogenase / 2-oxoglutarate reductase